MSGAATPDAQRGLGALGIARFVHARAGLALPVSVSAPEVQLLAWTLLGALAVSAIPAWRAYRDPLSAALKR